MFEQNKFQVYITIYCNRVYLPHLYAFVCWLYIIYDIIMLMSPFTIYQEVRARVEHEDCQLHLRRVVLLSIVQATLQNYNYIYKSNIYYTICMSTQFLQ